MIFKVGFAEVWIVIWSTDPLDGSVERGCAGIDGSIDIVAFLYILGKGMFTIIDKNQLKI
jgi:hypothetical protein